MGADPPADPRGRLGPGGGGGGGRGGGRRAGGGRGTEGGLSPHRHSLKGPVAMAAFFPTAARRFAPYEGFANVYPDGGAEIARLVGPETSSTLGGGVVTYRRVKTTWHLPFD